MKVKFYIQCLNIIISKPQEINRVKFDNTPLRPPPSIFNDFRKKTGNFTYKSQTFLWLHRKIHHNFFLLELKLPACQHLPTSMIISICRPFSTLWTTFIPDALKICRTFLTPIRYYWLVDSFFSYFPSAAPLRSLPLPFFFLIPNSNATLCCPC